MFFNSVLWRRWRNCSEQGGGFQGGPGCFIFLFRDPPAADRGQGKVRMGGDSAEANQSHPHPSLPLKEREPAFFGPPSGPAYGVTENLTVWAGRSLTERSTR